MNEVVIIDFILNNAARDYVKDRLLMKEGVATIRFTAKECYNTPNLVVDEFLSILNQINN